MVLRICISKGKRHSRTVMVRLQVMEYDRTDMVSLAVTAIAVVAFRLYVIFGPMN